MSFRKLLPEIELKLCEEYSNTRMSEIELSEKYGVSRGVIRDIRKRNNIPKRRHNSPKTNLIRCDENYFESINSKERAYWLGFIAADGCIKKRKDLANSLTLSIGLADKDINHLNKLKIDLNSDHPLKLEKYFHKKAQKYYETVYLRVARNKICDDLIKHGVGRNKSKELSLPNLPYNLMRHYIRGYFDGDGSWYINKMNTICFSIISSVESYVIQFQKFIKEKCQLNMNSTISFNRNSYQFIYSGNIQTKRIYDYLYEDGGPWLDRKYKKSTDHFISRGHDIIEQRESLNTENLNTLWNEKESKEKND